MPSEKLLAELQADDAADPYLYLLTVDHADLSAPLRWVRDHVAVTSGGETFAPFPFNFVRPGEGEGGSRSARIVIDNVDAAIVRTLRALASPPTLTIRTVFRSAPDTVEEEFPPFELRVASGNRMQLEGELTDVDDDNEPVMKWIMTPAMAPALVS